MWCHHYHDEYSGKCGCGNGYTTAVRIVQRMSYKTFESELKTETEKHQVSKIKGYRKETVTEKVPIVKTRTVASAGNRSSYTTHHTESVYGYVNGSYVQTGTRNVYNTTDTSTPAKETKEEYVDGYQTVTKEIDVPEYEYYYPPKKIFTQVADGMQLHQESYRKSVSSCKCCRVLGAQNTQPGQRRRLRLNLKSI
jgi:hypothetical protein